MTTTEETPKQGLYKLSILLLLLFTLNLIIVICLDLYFYKAEELSFANLEIWRWDGNISGDRSERNGLGYAKIASAIMGVVALLTLLGILPKIHHRWMEKKRRRFATLVYFSAVFLAVARIFDVFFVISASDLNGLIYSIGQFDISLDVLANACYICFAYEVFILKDVHEQQKANQWVLAIAFMAAFASIINTLDVYITNFPIVVFGAISYLVLAIIFIFSLKIAAQIFRLRTMVEENRRSLGIIGIQMLLFASMLVFLALSINFGGDFLFLNYIFRTIKEFMIIVIAVLYIPAFINPK